MSSTNRSAVRQPDDFYETPGWAVDTVLPGLRDILDNPDARILEPGCGRGAVVKRLIAAGVAPSRITGVELDEQRAFECLRTTEINLGRGDFLEFPWGDGFHKRHDLAIGNPPYSLAMEFFEHAILRADTVALLLRQGFSGSQDRAPWHRANPTDMRLLPRRPSFTEHLHWKFGWEKKSGAPQPPRCELRVETPDKPRDKWPRCRRAAGHPDICMLIGTDSCEYAWFIYGAGLGGRWCVLEVPS